MANAISRGVRVSLIAASALTLSLSAATAQESKTFKLGIVSFLSGAAAGPFGIPARNAAELMVEAINEGTIPAPHGAKGIGGATVEPVIIDEAGGTTKQVTEFRNLVQRQNVDAVVGYISSGSCLAIAPVAEELKMLTVFFDCGTPRIFEDGEYEYVFRTSAHATMDNTAAARYVLDKFPDVKTYGAINQNYAWGQDSWRDFTASMKALKPDSQVTTEQFPKLFAGQFNSEISALLASNSDAIHSSLWGGDLESFIFQASARGLPQRTKLVMTAGETAVHRLGAKMPDGIIIGARGPYGVYSRDTELNRWFQSTYADRYGSPAIYPSYHMAQAILGLKVAYDKAAEGTDGQLPTREQAIEKFENLEYEAFGNKVQMALGNGHQAITDTAYGQFKFDKETGTATVTDVVYYAAECVNPPPGVNSVEWIEGGMKGAKCE